MPDLKIIVYQQGKIIHTTLEDWCRKNPTYTPAHIHAAIKTGNKYRGCYFDEDIE